MALSPRLRLSRHYFERLRSIRRPTALLLRSQRHQDLVTVTILSVIIGQNNWIFLTVKCFLFSCMQNWTAVNHSTILLTLMQIALRSDIAAQHLTKLLLLLLLLHGTHGKLIVCMLYFAIFKTQQTIWRTSWLQERATVLGDELTWVLRSVNYILV